MKKNNSRVRAYLLRTSRIMFIFICVLLILGVPSCTQNEPDYTWTKEEQKQVDKIEEYIEKYPSHFDKLQIVDKLQIALADLGNDVLSKEDIDKIEAFNQEIEYLLKEKATQKKVTEQEVSISTLLSYWNTRCLYKIYSENIKNYTEALEYNETREKSDENKTELKKYEDKIKAAQKKLETAQTQLNKDHKEFEKLKSQIIFSDDLKSDISALNEDINFILLISEHDDIDGKKDKLQKHELQQKFIEFAARQISRKEYRDLLQVLNFLVARKFFADLTEMDNHLLVQQYRAECNFMLGKYDLAHQQYFTLETMLRQFNGDIKDINHPLYAEVQTRVKQSEKMSSRADRRDLLRLQLKIDENKVTIGIILLIFILLVIFFTKWHQHYEKEGRWDNIVNFLKGFYKKSGIDNFSRVFKKVFTSSPCFRGLIFILKKDEIITEKEMLKQDGRVSKETYNKVKLLDNINTIEVMLKKDAMIPKRDYKTIEKELDKVKNILKDKPKQKNQQKNNIYDEAKGNVNKVKKILEKYQQQGNDVSAQAFEMIKNELDKIKVLETEDSEIHDDEKKYATFILLGRKMIKRMNAYVPYPLAFIARIPGLRKLPHFCAFTIFSIVFVVAWGLSSYNLNGFVSKADLLIYPIITLFLITIVLLALLVGIRLMARKTIDSLDELITIVEYEESIAKLNGWLRGLLRSPWQLFITIFMAGLCILLHYLKSEPLVSGDTIFVLFVIMCVSSMIWFILRSFSLTNSICKLKDLRTSTNPLSPMKTLGLQKWITVIGNYAVVGSMVLTFGASIPVIRALIKHQQLSWSEFIWLFLFVPLLAVYWIFPYLKLSEAVRSIKRRRMHFMKTKISSTFEEWMKKEEETTEIKENYDRLEKEKKEKTETKKILKRLEEKTNRKKEILNRLEEYYDLFQKVDKSPESYFDFSSFLELAKVIGFPSLIVAIITYFFL